MSMLKASSPHIHGPAAVNAVMLEVSLALLPALAAYTWLFGWGVIFNVLLAIATALLSEAAVLRMRGREVAATLGDGSALLTALLLAIALPPLAPWWLIVVGTAFAIIFAKQLYGGLGFNPFNPAMVGYVVLLISFPLEMTSWLAPLDVREHTLDLSATAAYVFGGQLPLQGGIDSLTMATPLDTVKTRLGLEHTMGEILRDPVLGILGGRGWEIVNAMVLLGGLWMLFRRLITWHVPVAMLGTLFVTSGLFHLIDPEHYSGPLFHIASGGALLGAFFIATDPVSGATSTRGRIIFGIGVGLFTFIIRAWGGYPDGVAFSILLMNMAAPTIDYYTRPRVFGHTGGH
ncbi:MAG: electron transport complex subunit RsxD [Gammaproteobacteria bacterium]|nr:electron transport complex subunit RsxD [Gammaproteobacteria bacterium]MCW8839346.1 electron transport complex subunit RsxD [Gammaproteobacteria bacterium]MCW8958048.1 electron transport complex subunit RsxD [Gammaproteobacteria bacterium]MCW8973460.1 electron transport complex subunit RsxD [Gammaproteobacteria bacterium]MCW8991621.1 electron transport complex subunit RsxD [Gammaproteobacteria bacterium]